MLANIERVLNSEFDIDIAEQVNRLTLAYDEDSEKRLKEDIKKMYEMNRIPTVGRILDIIESDNYDTFHGITYTLLKYKKSDNILCQDKEGFEKECGTIGYHVCEECAFKDDCYDNVFYHDVQWEFGDQTFPMHLGYLLYSVLSDGDLCVYLESEDLFHYEDFVDNYEYGNSYVLEKFFRSNSSKLAIINHAQPVMFDDLYERDDDGCVYNYGNFILFLDPFERKKRESYYIGGGQT